MGTESGERYRRILLTRMKFIGDVVLTTPVIHRVRQSFPGAYIAYLGGKEAVALLERNPYLDEIIAFDFSRPTLLEQTRVASVLRSRRFDLAMDLLGNPRSALLTWLSGARVRIGPAKRGRGRLYTVRVHDDGTVKTAIQFHNQYLRAAGIAPSATLPELFLSEEEHRDARIYLHWLGQQNAATQEAKPFVGLHPGASWPAKRWPPERFAALADTISAKLGARVIVTVGPNDADVVATLQRHSFSALTVLPVLPLRQLAAVIARCRVFVSNDAGPMHIAAALGVPTIGLFGPGQEEIWFPYDATSGHQALRKDVPCHPCHLHRCNRGGEGYMECMRRLTLDEVAAAVERSLAH